MLKLNKIACVLIVALVTLVLLSQHSTVVHGATTSTTSGSSLRDWLESLKGEASTLQGKSNQLERTVAILMESNSTIVQTRISQLAKIKNALSMLNVEIQVINQACSTKGGQDCNIICPKGLNGTECATVLCDSKCLNCSSTGDCLLCSGNWNGTTCSVCKVGWTGSNCTLVDTRGDLVTSSILNTTMATRFVSDIISAVKKNAIKLIFRYSRDGISCTSGAFALASQVNGKGPTFLIIKATTGAIFGGYTSLSWTSNAYANDPSAFIFSIQSNTGDQRFTKLLPTTRPGNEIYLVSPTYFGFGGGHDLCCGCVNGGLGGYTNPFTYQSLGQHYLTGSGIQYQSSVGSSAYTALDFELYTL